MFSLIISNSVLFFSQVDPLDLEGIHNTFLSSTPYSVMTYKEAIDILTGSRENFKVKPTFEDGLAKEHELYLVKHLGNRPIFVIEWPAHLKAFYMKRSKDASTVCAFILLVT